MAKIRDIINRELIVRQQKVNYTQEYGVTGENDNIYEEQGHTVFETEYKIDKISFVTINGITQAEGRDYVVRDDKFSIEFTGIIMNNRTVIVGYYYEKIRRDSITLPPVLDKFFITPSSGEDNIIIFTFNILQHDGRNIFWSIHKDGAAEVVKNTNGESLSGTGLNVDGIDGTKLINYEITQAEYEERAGEDIPFTLIVVYDLHDDGSSMDEKLVGSAVYSVDDVVSSILEIDVLPDGTIVSPVTDKDFNINYNITRGSYDAITWELTSSSGDILDSGTEINLPVNKNKVVTHSFSAGDSNVTYTLSVTENGSTQVAHDTIHVNIPIVLKKASAGWWANARINDLATAAEFKFNTEDNGYNYWWEYPGTIAMPAVGALSSEINITPSQQVLDDEPSGPIRSQLSIFKIPKDWGNVEIKTESGGQLNDWEIREGNANDDYNWWHRTTGVAIGSTFTFKIKRVQ
jgi:hypothetical protein